MRSRILPGRSLRGLDWFIFFVADIQTGFGPFIAVYLTSQKWTQIDIGLVLSAGGLIALLGQMPGGALVDAARSERLVAGLALSAIAVAALAYAFAPVFPVVLAAACLHAAASCVLGPCIVAMSLGLVGHAAIGERLGRNARFAAIGNGMAAAAMGAVGYFFEPRAVFFVTAMLLVPTLVALSQIRPAEVDPDRAHGGPVPQKTDHSPVDVRTVVRKRAAADPGGLRLAVSHGQCLDAAAHGQRRDDALQRMGDGADRRLHRGAAGRSSPWFRHGSGTMPRSGAAFRSCGWHLRR